MRKRHDILEVNKRFSLQIIEERDMSKETGFIFSFNQVMQQVLYGLNHLVPL